MFWNLSTGVRWLALKALMTLKRNKLSSTYTHRCRVGIQGAEVIVLKAQMLEFVDRGSPRL